MPAGTGLHWRPSRVPVGRGGCASCARRLLCHVLRGWVCMSVCVSSQVLNSLRRDGYMRQEDADEDGHVGSGSSEAQQLYPPRSCSFCR